MTHANTEAGTRPGIEGHGLNGQDLFLIGVGIITAFFFWVTIFPSSIQGFYRPYPGSFFVKFIPTGLLALLLYRRHSSPGEFLLFCGLLLQSVGAVIIDFDRLGHVLPALLAAALGLCFYITAFLREYSRGSSSTPLPASRKLLICAISLYALTLGAFLLTHLIRANPLMSPAVIAYMLILPAVSISAILARKSLVTVLGGLCFLVQDSIFGWHLYVAPLHNNYLAIWPLYFAGQVLLTTGHLRK